jgi:hypothetical protein
LANVAELGARRSRCWASAHSRRDLRADASRGHPVDGEHEDPAGHGRRIVDLLIEGLRYGAVSAARGGVAYRAWAPEVAFPAAQAVDREQP